jgi:hypothetical protein
MTAKTTAQTAWPEGVVARYLTLAGQTLADSNLTVDIHAYDPIGKLHPVKCTVCPWEEKAWGNPYLSEHLTNAYIERRANESAHAWAQKHAETCRAMPKPDGAR